MESKTELILHPVRLKIIRLLVNTEMTVSDIKEILTDVPQASLYRNIKKLVDNNLIDVVDERPVRGTLEKVYTVKISKTQVSEEELKALSPEDHIKYFTGLVASLMDDFENYFNQDGWDYVKDQVILSQMPLYLSNKEMKFFIADLQSVLLKYMDNKAGRGRRPRYITQIIIPGREDENK